MIPKHASQALLTALIALMAALYVLTLGDSLQEAYLTAASLALIALSLGLERRAPLRRDWNESRGDTLGDIGSFVAVFGLLDGALKWLSPFLIIALLPHANAHAAADAGTIASLPLWAQIALATLLIELGAWASHWAHHRLAPLWALHAMHHSTERLYTLNNFRFHPLNHVLNYLVMFLPLLALGVSPEAILGYTALSLPVLLLQHSNVGFDFGVLDRLFNTNTLHRWHHSARYKEGMHNFGRALVIWDQLFGTYYNPGDKAAPRAVGLAGKGYPRANRTLRQLCWPFSPACCRD